MKEKLQRFMYGRYGLDSFGKFTIIVSLVLMLLANFVPARLGSVLSLLCWALLIYTYFRMFSRQTYKRACENQAYLAKTAKVRHFFASQKSIMAQSPSRYGSHQSAARARRGGARLAPVAMRCKSPWARS